MDVTNTSNQDPALHLIGSLSDGTDNYVLNQESRGAQQVVASDNLPADAKGLGEPYSSDGWPEFEALGFVKGDPVPGDELFVRAQLPAGWSKQAGTGSYWTHIVDQRGLKRVAIFYKAAFYDRRAHMQLVPCGSDLASDTIYGDGPATLPAQYAVLTDDEREQFNAYVKDHLQRGEAHPDIYDATLPRAKALASALNL